MKLSSITRPEGHPSMTTPIAGPCDSPNVVMRKILPKEFPMKRFEPWMDLKMPNYLFLKYKVSRRSQHQQNKESKNSLLPVVFTYEDRKSTRLNSSHLVISYAVLC